MSVHRRRFIAALALTAGLIVLWAGGAAIGQTATFRPLSLAIDGGTKTATATAGAATLNKGSGIITSEALTTAAAGTYTLTITNSAIAATDQVFASVQNGTSTTGLPEVTTVAPGSGTITVVIRNAHASAALNGTIQVTFLDLKP